MRDLKSKNGIAAAIVSAVLFTGLSGTPRAAEPPGKSHVVEIKGFKFQPAQLNVSPGDTIVWINRDIVPHTATASDKSWDSKSIPKGAKWEMIVKAGMRITYFCRFHPAMKGRIQFVPK